jgi:hypothetical protein
MISDEPVILMDLSLTIHTLRVEKKACLSIESSPGREEGGGDQLMTPKFLNKAFLAKSTQYIQLKRHKEPYNSAIETSK